MNINEDIDEHSVIDTKFVIWTPWISQVSYGGHSGMGRFKGLEIVAY